MLLKYFGIAMCLNRQGAMHVVRAFHAGVPSVAGFTKAHYFTNGYAQCISSYAEVQSAPCPFKALFTEDLFALAGCFVEYIGLKCYHIT
jgi:hypothetical protein